MKITTGHIIRSICISLLGAVLAQSLTAANHPNILLVVADDMGWTDIGSFGSEIHTPNLDALAEEGVVFTDHHVSLSCSPTRSMLLSGTDNHIAGVGNMAELLTDEQRGKPGYEGYLNDRVVSLAEVLEANGYHTYMGGKWHLGHEPEHIPHARGFEEVLSMLDGAASHWYDKFGALPAHPEANYTENDRFLKELPDDFFSSRSYTDFLINAIRKNHGDGKPFLAYLAFTAPHDPLHVPHPWASRYEGLYDEGYEVLKARRTEAAKRLGRYPAGASEAQISKPARSWDSLSAKSAQWRHAGWKSTRAW